MLLSCASRNSPLSPECNNHLANHRISSFILGNCSQHLGKFPMNESQKIISFLNYKLNKWQLIEQIASSITASLLAACGPPPAQASLLFLPWDPACSPQPAEASVISFLCWPKHFLFSSLSRSFLLLALFSSWKGAQWWERARGLQKFFSRPWLIKFLQKVLQPRGFQEAT